MRIYWRDKDSFEDVTEVPIWELISPRVRRNNRVIIKVPNEIVTADDWRFVYTRDHWDHLTSCFGSERSWIVLDTTKNYANDNMIYFVFNLELGSSLKARTVNGASTVFITHWCYFMWKTKRRSTNNGYSHRNRHICHTTSTPLVLFLDSIEPSSSTRRRIQPISWMKTSNIYFKCVDFTHLQLTGKSRGGIS